MKSRWNRSRRETVARRSRAAGVYIPAAWGGAVPRSAWRRQYLGQEQHHQSFWRGRARHLCEGQWLGSRDDRGGRVLAVPHAAAAGPGEARTLSDPQMAAELRKSLTDVSAPSPSVEAILHAILPARFVDHTHADAILDDDQLAGRRASCARALWGPARLYPLRDAGIQARALVRRGFPAQARRNTVGMLLLNHGLFTFGETAKRGL